MPRKTAVVAAPKAPSVAVRKPRVAHRKVSSAASPVEATELEKVDATSEDIARLAYVLWEQRGCPEGSPEEDWLRAEQLLLG